eukprot:CAMPEP_0196740254 /NCGR_PEP_ID=MMETSP1091-20130531/30690_1 /TAXON_ID=302021 /ORGANISM="Rhodomonas sp., Strain CCMP768" /LENGTH=233 /DNA_ID=CAMNT_0042085311 /DNA_START=21 /DNA_END=722 /DNA_ORIENTATION=-
MAIVVAKEFPVVPETLEGQLEISSLTPRAGSENKRKLPNSNTLFESVDLVLSQSLAIEPWRSQVDFKLAREMHNSSSLLALDDELFGAIFRHMDWRSLVLWSSTSRNTRRIVEHLDESYMALQVGKLQKVYSLLVARQRNMNLLNLWEGCKVDPVGIVLSSDLKVAHPQFCARLQTARSHPTFDLHAEIERERLRMAGALRWLLRLWRGAWQRQAAFHQQTRDTLQSPKRRCR